eukprot:GILJ01009909.1.p1 GENE.GILJ01009909.1~~GILJ01009909.1.p1  ORF type:complete len:777 (+),score=142.69 GILJ01009909.1:103-2433(+)
MAVQIRLWWIFVLQVVLLAATLGGIIAAFSVTGTAAVNRAVDESVRNNLGNLESSVWGYMSPIPRVADRINSYRKAYGASCAIMGWPNTTEAQRSAFFTELGLCARMFEYIAYAYFVQQMANGLTSDCSAISDGGAISTQYLTLEQMAYWDDCPEFPCNLDGTYATGNETLDLEDEAYVLAIKSVTSDFATGKWLRPTSYYEPALNATILSSTYMIPFQFDDDNHTVSAVVVDVSLSWFRDALMEQRNTPTTVISVVDIGSGMILSTTADVPDFDFEADDIWSVDRLPSVTDRDKIKTAASRMGITFGDITTAGDDATTLVYESDDDVISARIIRDGTLIWFAVVSTPQSYYYGTSRKVMTIVTVVACIVSFAICAISVAVWIGVVLPLKKMTEYMEQVANLEFLSVTSNGKGSQPVLGELEGMHGAFKDMTRAIQSFTQYVPIEVVRSLMESGERVDVRMVPARCTIFFCDIAGFTTMCERINTVTLAEVTRLYFDRMSIVVVAYGGTIDKFIGDCIMAIWGAPIETKDANLLAACCSLRLLQETKMDPLKKEFSALGFPLKVRIGVHCGDVLAGNIGCSLRLSYTVLGDAVNTAARLESLNKQFGTQLMISEDVAASLSDYFVMRRLSRVAVVGKLEALRVYEIIGINAHRLAHLDEGSLCEQNSHIDVPSQGLVPCEQVFADIANPIFCPTQEQIDFAALYTDAVAFWERNRLDECKGAINDIRNTFEKEFLASYDVSIQQLHDQCELAADTGSQFSRNSSIGNARVFVAVGK